MNERNERPTCPDPLTQPMARQLATLAFPHVTLTGDEVTALDAAVLTGVDAPYNRARDRRGARTGGRGVRLPARPVGCCGVWRGAITMLL